jgi:hypothetical protein
MIRLIRIEFHKLWTTRSFKVLLALWLLAFISIPIAGTVGLAWLESLGLDLGFNLKAGDLPLFDFEDIWQNLAYVYKCLTIFVSFMIIISVGNEFRYKTMRQNIIDGLSKREFWFAKVSLILFFSFIAALLVLVLGLIVGYANSPVTSMDFVMMNIEFVGAYFMHVVHFLAFCMFITLLIQKSGISIALLIFYIYIIEPITTLILEEEYKLVTLADSFPMESAWMLIKMPIPKYALQQVQDYVAMQDVLISGAWIIALLWGSYALIVKRDLN